MIQIDGVKPFDAAAFTLGGSKSESNRALMIAAYSGLDSAFVNSSESDDTRLLKELLQKISRHASGEPLEVDCRDAGTVCRFLLTYLATHEGTYVLTGCERLCHRPIKNLVDCLRRLGAEIEYVSCEGQLPVSVKGKKLEGGNATIDAALSSQFVSSLLLAAPMFQNGLALNVEGCSSAPYIDMTVDMMVGCGAEIERNGKTIRVLSKPYSNTSFVIENDWSSASYMYEYAALQPGVPICIDGLSLNSRQGDRAIAGMMAELGIQTFETERGIRIFSTGTIENNLSFDFSDCPDLFPAVCATCAGLGVKTRFTGIGNLVFKESDRVEAMRNELAKIGAVLTLVTDCEAVLTPDLPLPRFDSGNRLLFKSYDDHRIAMSLSLLTLRIGKFVIDNENCVSKSFPGFWSLFK